VTNAFGGTTSVVPRFGSGLAIRRRSGLDAVAPRCEHKRHQLTPRDLREHAILRDHGGGAPRREPAATGRLQDDTNAMCWTVSLTQAAGQSGRRAGGERRRVLWDHGQRRRGFGTVFSNHIGRRVDSAPHVHQRADGAIRKPPWRGKGRLSLRLPAFGGTIVRRGTALSQMTPTGVGLGRLAPAANGRSRNPAW